MVTVEYFDKIHHKKIEIEVTEEVAKVLATKHTFATGKKRAISKVRHNSDDFPDETQDEKEIIALVTARYEEQKRMLYMAMRKITNAQRIVTIKRHYEGKTMEQIAKEFEISRPAVHNILTYAYKKMRKYLLSIPSNIYLFEEYSEGKYGFSYLF